MHSIMTPIAHDTVDSLAADCSTAPFSAFPAAQGLYDPRNERDACGVGFCANLNKVKRDARAFFLF